LLLVLLLIFLHSLLLFALFPLLFFYFHLILLFVLHFLLLLVSLFTLVPCIFLCCDIFVVVMLIPMRCLADPMVMHRWQLYNAHTDLGITRGFQYSTRV